MQASVLARDAHALEDLNALAGALDHLDADPDRIAGREFGHGPGLDELLDLLFIQFLDNVHDTRSFGSSLFVAPSYSAHRSGRRSRVTFSASA